MCEYVIMTESTADLTQELLEQNNIEFIKMSYLVDGVEHVHSFREEDMSEFYNCMRADKLITTVQINEMAFVQRWTPLLDQGKDILYLAFTSKLSGTYDSACLARDNLAKSYPERKLIVIDSTCAALGEGILVLYAAKQRAAGMDIDSLAALIEERKYYVNHWVTPQVLHYLHRGGRLSGAAAFIGTLLYIKPIIHIDLEGRLVAYDKVKGRRKSIRYLYDRFVERYIPGKDELVGIVHADCFADANNLKEMIEQSGRLETDVIITPMGPIIGAHTGPGLISLFFFGQKRLEK